MCDLDELIEEPNMVQLQSLGSQNCKVSFEKEPSVCVRVCVCVCVASMSPHSGALFKKALRAIKRAPFYQKSHVFYQKSPILNQKSPMFIKKSPALPRI